MLASLLLLCATGVGSWRECVGCAAVLRRASHASCCSSEASILKHLHAVFNHPLPVFGYFLQYCWVHPEKEAAIQCILCLRCKVGAMLDTLSWLWRLMSCC